MIMCMALSVLFLLLCSACVSVVVEGASLDLIFDPISIGDFTVFQLQTEDGPLNYTTYDFTYRVTVNSLGSAPSCALEGGNSNDTVTNTINIVGTLQPDETYKVKQTQPNFWFGKSFNDTTGEVIGYLFLYIKSHPELPDRCLITGHWRSLIGSDLIRGGFNFKTRIDDTDGSIEYFATSSDESYNSYLPEPIPPPFNDINPVDEPVAGKLTKAEEPDDGNVIDVMVPYTKFAMCIENVHNLDDCDESSLGNHLAMKNRIEMLIAEANTVYANSNIELELRLVHSYMVTDYSEPQNPPDGEIIIDFDVGPDFLSLLENMTLPDGESVYAFTDANGNTLHELRDQYCADIVVLVLYQYDNVLNALGIANSAGPDSSDGFVAIASIGPQAISSSTFTHETAHLLGARHQNINYTFIPGVWFYEPDCGAGPLGFEAAYAEEGELEDTYEYVSLMGTGCTASDGCLKIPAFSGGEDFLFDGRILGSAIENNAQAIREAKLQVSNFRSSSRCVVAGQGPEGQTPSQKVRLKDSGYRRERRRLGETMN